MIMPADKVQPVNLTAPQEVYAQGWRAEERDAAGHLLSTHSAFEDDESIVWYVREAMKRGGIVTIWPHDIKTPSKFDLEAG